MMWQLFEQLQKSSRHLTGTPNSHTQRARLAYTVFGHNTGYIPYIYHFNIHVTEQCKPNTNQPQANSEAFDLLDENNKMTTTKAISPE